MKQAVYNSGKILLALLALTFLFSFCSCFALEEPLSSSTPTDSSSLYSLYDQFQQRYQEDLDFRKEVDTQANESYRVSSQVLMDMAKQQYDYIQAQKSRDAVTKYNQGHPILIISEIKND